MTEKKNLDKKNEEDSHHNMDLRGTFMMVLFLGGLMLLSWFGAFILFMERM
ncbi:cytochrome c oxidase subunit 2A [Jeotgalicoccus sp. ATCC 8456]|jgi:hypothetical protein|uniref:cytochrome c oxidase subunit 2A n=1 Tax=Jeotgalicoccus sp. ATCC 8456 TaxID=946435 RepID=UPI0018E663F6|nr:cytochrome c oxidase subunit 2A [Jeotgalicoccus sp. ATCC 8456]QQD85559.1 cytochrome c oxidase subunit 2A [Jeotgalicoccus sp. ATCC 8456]